MIRCSEIFNRSCLRCEAINPKLIRVGALYFCAICWMDIFDGQEDFEPDSYSGKQYYRWLDIYKEKERINGSQEEKP